MQRTKPTGGIKPTERRIPKNPRFEDVRPQVDSGFNEIKFNEKFDVSRMNIRFRRDENFRRLKTTTVARLVSGEDECDFLLLDLREIEDFQVCHINNALSYPAPMLHRSVNNFTPEILAYANKEPERIIIIYDDDERIAATAANLFFEKGTDNVLLLTGGLRKFGSEFPELVEGDLPRPRSPAGSTRSKAMSVKSAASGRSVASSVRSGISSRSSPQPRYGTEHTGAWK
uniref:Rhodanese domain-containing protein n=1 Tax=Pyramimonas obovata TaxID=1411642 RepID=A0A7S0RQB0_9CHLO|mmetsp:Transcript_39827/g.86708  ORF Transcript_39827/g.86708 Transcript_39827/m.86708 type:complete len:229 (+) Transcript_39827:151-837(+)